MKRLIFLMFLSVLSCAVYAQKADDILNKSTEAYKKANGIKVDFHLNSKSDKQNISESFEGKIEMNGEKFLLTTADMIVWFDGKTQWTYIAQNEEVTVSEPTSDELHQINPLILLSNYKKNFKASYIGESSLPNGKAFKVKLSSKDKKNGETVELEVDKKTYLPVRIVADLGNGFKTTIAIRHLEADVNYSSSYFVFKKAVFPQAEIIDLR